MLKGRAIVCGIRYNIYGTSIDVLCPVDFNWLTPKLLI
jgi:hypothetical protein